VWGQDQVVGWSLETQESVWESWQELGEKVEVVLRRSQSWSHNLLRSVAQSSTQKDLGSSLTVKTDVLQL
jgi:hypothetical protein